MPRIRTLKPEALQHRKVGRLSDRAFRLWVACITQADDHGRLIFDPEQFRVLVWGYHAGLKTRDVVQAATELLAGGLVRGHAVDKSGDDSPNLILEFPSWGDHQKVDHPRKSTLPAWSPPGADLFSRAFAQVREAARDVAKTRRGSNRTGRKEGSDALEPARVRDAPGDAAPRGSVRSSVSVDSEQRGEDDGSGQRQTRGKDRQPAGPLSGALAAVLAQIRVVPERTLDSVPREHAEI